MKYNIIENLKLETTTLASEDYCKLLKETGMEAAFRKYATPGYPKITREAIKDYLFYISEDYVPKKSECNKDLDHVIDRLYGMTLTRIFYPTHGNELYNRLFKESILQIDWNIELLQDYEGVPPKEILKDLKHAKLENYFDNYLIITVGVKIEDRKNYKLDDPLLVGTINDKRDQWLIGYWDNDVTF